MAKERKGKAQYREDEMKVRVMVDADVFFLTRWLMDPVVLGYFPMSNLREVQEATKIWQLYARRGSAYTIEVNGTPMGMANLYVHTYEKMRYQSLFAIVVGPEHRGKGVGGHLLRHVIKQARDTYGMHRLHLEVYQGNPAYNLYKRHGFVEYGKHENFLKEADGSYEAKILMELDLTKAGGV